MPIYNLRTHTHMPHKALLAGNAASRLVGLLGDDEPDEGAAAYFTPCNGIHTFGMRYPLDVVFLDRDGTVLRCFRGLPPNRVTGIVPGARSALEFPGNAAADVMVGDILEVAPDAPLPVNARGARLLGSWALHLFFAALWLGLAAATLRHWANGGGPAGLGLVAAAMTMHLALLAKRRSPGRAEKITERISNTE